MDTKVKQLVKIGGSEWQKDDRHRVYFNNLPELYGLVTERYNTGNISAAWLEGREISNSAAKRIENRLSGRVFYDVADGQFHGQNIEQEDFNVIFREIETRLAALETSEVA